MRLSQLRCSAFTLLIRNTCCVDQQSFGIVRTQPKTLLTIIEKSIYGVFASRKVAYPVASEDVMLSFMMSGISVAQITLID